MADMPSARSVRLLVVTAVLLLSLISDTQAAYDKYKSPPSAIRGDIPEAPEYGWGWGLEDEDFDEDFDEEDYDYDEDDWDEEDEEDMDIMEEEINREKIPRTLWHEWLSKTESRDRQRPHRGHRGQIHLSPYFQVNWDLRLMLGDKWWEGPNVCQRLEESEENVTSPLAGSLINRHHMMSSSVCDDTGTVYKCTSEVKLPTVKRKASLIYECCHGYQREQGKPGCTKELHLETTIETLKSLEAGDMIEALEGVSLAELLEDGNYTVFASSSGILGNIRSTETDLNQIVRVTPDLLDMARDFEETVSSHIVEGFVKTTHLEDEQLVPTLSSGDNIRINIYETPKRLLTANCRPITSSDNIATNGVVHVIDGVLSPVKDSIADVVSKNPDLSLLKTGRSGVLSMLKRDGQMTLLAPSNTAFSRLNPYVKDRLLSGDICLQDVIRNHLLPNVICSGILDGHLRTINVLNNYLGVSRRQDKLFVEGAQILETDLMATNGVVHIIDDVLIPREAMTLPEVVRNINSTKMADLIRQAGLTDEFSRLSNFTAFVPSDGAFERLSESSLSALKDDPVWLREVLKYHILNATVDFNDLTDNGQHSTMSDGREVLVKSYRKHPFSAKQVKTVQCATVQKPDIGTCDGTVHVIDRILMPPKEHVLQALQDDENFSVLLSIMNKTNLHEELLNMETFTFFAPTNEALEKMDPTIMEFLMENPDNLAKFLKYHITKDTICCSGTPETQFMLLSRAKHTIDGNFVTTRRHGNRVYVNRVPIEKCDNMVTNGVIHAIDDVLPEAINRHVIPYTSTQSPKRKNRLVSGFQHVMDHLDNGMMNFRQDHSMVVDTYMDKFLDHVFGPLKKTAKSQDHVTNTTMTVRNQRDRGIPRGDSRATPTANDRHHSYHPGFKGRKAAASRTQSHHSNGRNKQGWHISQNIKQQKFQRQRRRDRSRGIRRHQ